MISPQQFQEELNLCIQNALREDIGPGDYSSLACIPGSAVGTAKLLVKEAGIIAGVAYAKQIFEHVDPQLSLEIFIPDGSAVVPGDVVFHVSGSSQSILKAERVVLNSMQRMSAIATKTNSYVQLISGTGTQLLDTRKTTPGFRAPEKWAVTIGGGANHRFALYDMIMLKDNHIDFAGGIPQAIKKTKLYMQANNLDLQLIVEARNLVEVQEILEAGGVYRILLDNFDFETTRKAVEIIGNQCQTESSGNINENTLRAYAECGVNYISSGALTHSVYNMDLSLKAID
jgi:nicotinate-nucleotide pyrophosphorylase (carboxylating)